VVTLRSWRQQSERSLLFASPPIGDTPLISPTVCAIHDR
jgi:hypothetical protein